jgi:Sulfotransferase family
MHYHYALGNIFHDTKSFISAFEHYLKANTLKRKTITYDSQNHSGLVDRLIETYSENYFQEKTVYGSDSDLPVFIVGMPRSGTTLVEQIVSSHPQVYGAGELSFLENIERKIADQFEASNPYPECMTLCNNSTVNNFSVAYLKKSGSYSHDAKRITDKMPDNFLRVGLIKSLFPNSHIIHCQRNAMDTCTSIFLNHFVRGIDYAFDLTELGQYYLDYERLMAHWRSLFPSEIFEVKYEALVMNQESVSRQLIDYLGLEWDDRCLEFYKNKRAVRTASNLQVRKPMYNNSINRWQRYEEQLKPLIAILRHHI